MSKKGKKKRKKRSPGEEGVDEEDDDPDSQPELTLKEEQAKVEQEKEAILKNQALLEEVSIYSCLHMTRCDAVVKATYVPTYQVNMYFTAFAGSCISTYVHLYMFLYAACMYI